MEFFTVAKGEEPCALRLKLANRHGLIAGATGTGKSVTLRVLAEGFSAAGVPVFLSDVKGDLAGLALPGGGAKLAARAEALGLPFEPQAMPTIFWDLFGERGHPIRATISEMGPLLLARMLDLNDVQSGILDIVFKVADDEGLLLIDLKDLRAMLGHVAGNAKEYGAVYGNIAAASVGAIQRALLRLENQGGTHFFGEPAIGLDDFMMCDADGRGAVNVLSAEKLMETPRLYAAFLLWLLSELFEALPEVGDLDRPKLVFFFDEAHLLFDEAPKALVAKVEQVVRLIRSKGVGVFFVTQNPLDLPDNVLGQLGNRVQHALRAFTPRDQKAVRAAAETFRTNPRLSVAEVIGELAVGEALVSFLDEKGTPLPVDRARVRPPVSRLGTITGDERAAVIAASPLAGRYETAVDRVSAYEVLAEQSRPRATSWGAPPPERPAPADVRVRRELPPKPRNESRGRQSQSVAEAVTKSLARSLASSIGSRIGREVVRGILGSILRR